MIVINIALVILGILYGVGSVTNFSEWYYRHDYLAIALSVFTSILLILAGIFNAFNQQAYDIILWFESIKTEHKVRLYSYCVRQMTVISRYN